MITEAVLAKIRRESRYVLLAENINPGTPVQQDVYAGDLCDEIEQLHARAERAEAERDRHLAAIVEYLKANERAICEDTIEAGLAFHAAESALRRIAEEKA